MTATRVILTIDELVLHGFDPRDRHVIGDAVQAELGRLLARGDLPQGWLRGAEIPALSAPIAALPEGGRGPRAGRAVAQALHRGLTREPGESGGRR